MISFQKEGFSHTNTNNRSSSAREKKLCRCFYTVVGCLLLFGNALLFVFVLRVSRLAQVKHRPDHPTGIPPTATYGTHKMFMMQSRVASNMYLRAGFVHSLPC